MERAPRSFRWNQRQTGQIITKMGNVQVQCVLSASELPDPV